MKTALQILLLITLLAQPMFAAPRIANAAPAGTSSISGSAFVDLNNNGDWNGDEQFLPDVTLVLTGTTTTGASIGMTQTTDINGWFVFDALDAGHYFVRQIQPAGYFDAGEHAGFGATAQGVVANDLISVTLGPDEYAYGLRFAERVPLLGGLAFEDMNGDGTLQPDEPGLGYVEVDLDGAFSTTIFADDTGFFAFTGLDAGPYTVTLRMPANYTGTQTRISNINYDGTGIYDSLRFATHRPAGVRGAVFVDANQDGTLQPGETRISGVTITLNSAASPQTFVTVNGLFTFTGLAPGLYTVHEQQPAAYVDGPDYGPAGSAIGDDAITISVASGQVLTGVYFTEASAGIFGRVFHDHNDNGVQDPSDEDLNGTTVMLIPVSAGASPTRTTTTLFPGGKYSFTSVADGVYRLQAANSSGYMDGVALPGTQGGNVLNHEIVFTYAQSSVATQYDFGKFKPAFVGGFVYYDIDGDGQFRGRGCGLSDPYCLQVAALPDDVTQTPTQLLLEGSTRISATFAITLSSLNTGRFEFGGLRPGLYTLTQIARDVDADGLDRAFGTPGVIVENDRVRNIVLDSNARLIAQFGEQPALLGAVYRDDDEDGLRHIDADPCNNEPGIGNVTLRLTGIDIFNRAVNRTAFSFIPLNGDPSCYSGLFWFGGLITGTYQVSETQPSGYLDGMESIGTAGGLNDTNDLIRRIVISGGVSYTGYHWGEFASSISGRLYLDADGDGAYDVGEGSWLTSAQVRLTGRETTGAAVSRTIGTNGFYRFSPLRAGTYTVSVDVPAGHTAVGPTQIADIALANSQSITDIHFGATALGRILGQVHFLVADLVSPISGTRVSIQSTGYATQTVVDAFGNYDFRNVPIGHYTITHDSPPGYRPIYFGDEFCAGIAHSDTVRGLAVGMGQSYSCRFQHGPVIEGHVFLDNDDDRVRAVGEAPAEAVRLWLYGTLDNGAHTTQTMVSRNGRFGFGGLLTGTYTLAEDQRLDLYLDGRDTVGTGGGVLLPPVQGESQDVVAGIFYTPSLVYTGYDFGELRLAELRGLVFWDKGNDGFPSGSDLPLRTTVTVTGTNDLGEPISLTVNNASFAFKLRPGSYTLIETQPAGFSDGKTISGTRGGNVVSGTRIENIVLRWNDIADDYRFGERQVGISGMVYADIDRDGDYRPSPQGEDRGQHGVTVRLIGSGGVFSQTTVGGRFSFDLVPEGVYTLSHDVPEGARLASAKAGTAGGSVLGDVIAGVVVTADTYANGYEFGHMLPGTLSGHVYVDLNNDGFRSGAEPILPGVVITLAGTTSLGEPVTEMTRTDATGRYRFERIWDGTYSVIEMQPAFVDGFARAGQGAGGLAGENRIDGLVFARTIDATNYNFGERAGGVRGRVWADLNRDAQLQPAEPGLSPVTLRLRGTTDAGAVVDLTTRTGADGSYLFAALPGQYVLEMTPPFGYLLTAAPAHSFTLSALGTARDFVLHAPQAAELALAAGLDPAILLGATLLADGDHKAGIGTRALAGFPAMGGQFIYLGTGNMVFADQANSQPNTFGLGDGATLVITAGVPATATCLLVDFKFLSEEFPEFVGSAFNDHFDWVVDGVSLARDAQGNPISINTVFGAAPANAHGSTYDAATPRLQGRKRMQAGATTVMTFTISDIADAAYDSAVLIESIRFAGAGSACADGVSLPGETPSATLRVTTPVTRVQAGASFAASVDMVNVDDLGGYELALALSDGFSITAIAQGNLLVDTGRTVLPLATSHEPGRIRTGAVTLGTGTGAAGTGALVLFTVQAQAPGEILLTVDQPLLTTVGGRAISVTVEAARVQIVPADGTATPTPTVTPTTTPTATPSPTPTATPSPSPTRPAANTGHKVSLPLVVR